MQPITQANNVQYGYSRIYVIVGAALLSVTLSVGVPHVIETANDSEFASQHRRAEDAARTTMATVRQLSFESIGAGDTTSDPPYLGYRETNSSHPGFTAGEDRYFSDQLELAEGVLAERHVVVHDAGDNTKRVEVIVTWTHAGQLRSMLQRTYLRVPSSVVNDARTKV